MALRKEVRVLQVELVQARMSGLSGFGMGMGGGGWGEKAGGGRGSGGAAAAAAEEEAAELRRYCCMGWASVCVRWVVKNCKKKSTLYVVCPHKRGCNYKGVTGHSYVANSPSHDSWPNFTHFVLRVVVFLSRFPKKSPRSFVVTSFYFILFYFSKLWTFCRGC